MKARVVLFFLFFCINNFSQTVVSPHFIELKGIEDHQGNTHLFCRVFGYKQSELYFDLRNDVFHIDLSNYVDTLFFHGYQHTDPVSQSGYGVGDYDFWNSDFTKFIFSGSGGGTFEPGSFIKRFDSDEIYFNTLWGGVGTISISKQDDSLIFAGAENLCCSDGFQTIKSTDGGWNWFQVSDSLQFISLSPFNDKVMFTINKDGVLYKSTDGGNTFYLSDARNYVPLYDDFLFDGDQTHIYKLYFDSPNFRLLVSDNLGDYGSWHEEYLTDSNFVIFVDTSISGSLFLAEGNTINQSMNYGETFYPLATLESNVIGMYKKPNSDKLYAATQNKIYELTSDTAKIIKILHVPDEILNYNPMSIGDKWVYNYLIDPTNPEQENISGIYIREVLKDTTLGNGKIYYKIYDETLGNPKQTVYERIDSSSGKVYRYSEDPEFVNNEFLILDLSAETGDTIYSSRFFPSNDGVTMVTDTRLFHKWNLYKTQKVFNENSTYDYTLTQSFGIDSIRFEFDFGYGYITLKGCIINGIVYGDTSVVTSVDKPHPVLYRYELEQNYPNPFNPTTHIGFRIANFGLVTLKIYDVLGKEVATLVNEERPAGDYEIEFSAVGGSASGGDAYNLPSGVYFYQLKAGDFIKTNKMILIK